MLLLFSCLPFTFWSRSTVRLGTHALAPAVACYVPPPPSLRRIPLGYLSRTLLAPVPTHLQPQVPFHVSYLLASLFSATKSSHTIHHWASCSACWHSEHLTRQQTITITVIMALSSPSPDSMPVAFLALEAWSVSSGCRGLAVFFSDLHAAPPQSWWALFLPSPSMCML